MKTSLGTNQKGTCPVTHAEGITLRPDQSSFNSVMGVLNVLPLGGGGADLKAGEEHLVAVLPHDEGPDGTHHCLEQVENDLQQEVEGEGPGDHLAVTDSLIGEGASYWVLLIQSAHAVLARLLTPEAAGLRVMVSGEGNNQH